MGNIKKEKKQTEHVKIPISVIIEAVLLCSGSAFLREEDGSQRQTEGSPRNRIDTSAPLFYNNARKGVDI